MSMTLANADIYIARIIGGVGDTAIISQSRDALKSAFEELLHRNNWQYLQVDTSRSFTVAGGNSQDDDAIITTDVTDGFKNVLVGMTVTGTGVAAGAKVLTKTSVSTLVLDIDGTAGVTDNSTTFTFGGTIPIISGTDEYELPDRFWKPLSCRFTSARYTKIHYLTVEQWDAISGDQTNQGTTHAYTVYNGGRVFDPNTLQRDYLRFIRPPGANDVCLFKYYRLPNFSGTYVDIPDEYLYAFLDLAQIHLLLKKDAASNRIPFLYRLLEPRITRAISADRNPGGDDQLEMFITPSQRNNLEFDGNIWPKNYLGRG